MTSAYFARRLVWAAVTFIGITLASFALIHAVPGDPVTFYIARSQHHVPPAVLDAIRKEYNLDQPLVLQYVRWAAGAARLDFGRSTVDRQPVRERLWRKLPNTILLNTIAFSLAAAIGIPIGITLASRKGRRIERAASVLFFLLYSLPAFWLALLLIELFVIRTGWLPLLGAVSDDHETLSLGGRALDRLRHLVLPVTTLAVAQLAIFARFTSAALREVIAQDYITTARAKGLDEDEVIYRHALRNALLPLITLLGISVPALLSGSVIVETIFQWDGVGRLFYDSILARDYPTVLGLTVVTAVVVLIANLAADLLYALVDPRVRLEADHR